MAKDFNAGDVIQIHGPLRMYPKLPVDLSSEQPAVYYTAFPCKEITDYIITNCPSDYSAIDDGYLFVLPFQYKAAYLAFKLRNLQYGYIDSMASEIACDIVGYFGSEYRQSQSCKGDPKDYSVSLAEWIRDLPSGADIHQHFPQDELPTRVRCTQYPPFMGNTVEDAKVFAKMFEDANQ